MKIEHIREFMALVKTKNYSKAADQFYISQSSLSKHIAQLESEMDCPLLDRSCYGVVLTPIGQYAAGEFERILSIFGEMDANIESMKKGLSGNVKIGVPYYATNKYLLPMFRRFSKNYPQIKINTISGQPDQIFRDLREGRLDAGVIIQPEGIALEFEEQISFRLLYHERAVLLCRKSSALGEKEEVSIEDLQGQTFIRYESGLFMKTYNDAILQWLSLKGIRFGGEIYLDNIDFVSASIMDEGGVYIVPEHISSFHGDIHAAPIRDFPQIVTGFYYKEDNRNPALSLICDSLCRD